MDSWLPGFVGVKGMGFHKYHEVITQVIKRLHVKLVVDIQLHAFVKPIELFATKSKLYINFKNPPGCGEVDAVQMVTNQCKV